MVLRRNQRCYQHKIASAIQRPKTIVRLGFAVNDSGNEKACLQGSGILESDKLLSFAVVCWPKSVPACASKATQNSIGSSRSFPSAREFGHKDYWNITNHSHMWRVLDFTITREVRLFPQPCRPYLIEFGNPSVVLSQDQKGPGIRQVSGVSDLRGRREQFLGSELGGQSGAGRSSC